MMTRKESIEEQKRLAQAVKRRVYHDNIHGKETVIVSYKTAAWSHQEQFAFYFEKKGIVHKGHIVNFKGHQAKVETII